MSEDIYANPDLTKKVRFQKSEKEDRNEDVCDSIDNSVIYDNCWVQGSLPPNLEDNVAENQQQCSNYFSVYLSHAYLHEILYTLDDLKLCLFFNGFL